MLIENAIVQESQIETNNVYLNQKSLKKITENTDGVFIFGTIDYLF